MCYSFASNQFAEIQIESRADRHYGAEPRLDAVCATPEHRHNPSFNSDLNLEDISSADYILRDASGLMAKDIFVGLGVYLESFVEILLSLSLGTVQMGCGWCQFLRSSDSSISWPPNRAEIGFVRVLLRGLVIFKICIIYIYIGLAFRMVLYLKHLSRQGPHSTQWAIRGTRKN